MPLVSDVALLVLVIYGAYCAGRFLIAIERYIRALAGNPGALTKTRG